ncbi:hypothetical protein NE237_021800 [Protea cynaroides]|uniref:PWWP domain-containing protein n=1 Tax=Protea cynaroides TaxID=273540 RepID=A0A9Q0H9T5_9MAGN|nr:hypothetical protein NE237_021800 [Protea cynaroides]
MTTRMVDAAGEVISVLEKNEKDGNGGSRRTGASSELLKNGKEFSKMIVEGGVTVAEAGSAVIENKDSSGAQALPEMVLKEKGTSRLNGGDSSTKIEDSGDGIQLVVEIHGSVEAENRENEGNEVSVMPVPVVEANKNSSVKGKEEKEVDEGEEEEQVDNDEEREFSIGDFVWGKIKSHPWWPGQIYHPSDASKYAAKHHRRDRLLVAYFGDGTFAWCYPSQLKPFLENFELMANQSNSKSFLNAVEEAVDEIGRRVELEMTCTCVPEEFRSRLARRLAVNAGIREGVAVPDGGIDELTITRFEPADFLARLKDVAEVVSVNSILELTVIRSRLLAFYVAKGYWQLPMYYVAEGISSPEDSDINEEMHKSIVDVQTGELNLHLGEEDPLLSPVGLGISKSRQTSSQRRPDISDNKLHQRRKQKSMAEILTGGINADRQNNESDAAGEVVPGKPVSTSKKKRKKGSEYDFNVAAEDSGSGHVDLQTKKGKKIKLSISPPTADKKSSGNNDDAEAAAMNSSPRVRKKSKYLSPPYTDVSQGNKSLNSPKDSETVSPKAKKVSSIGEFIHRDADKLTGTPPTVRCSGQTFQKKPSEVRGVGRKTFGNLSPRTPNSDNYKTIFVEGNASTDEMLSDFLAIALDPFYLKESPRFDTFKSFFSRFRSSMYHNKSNSTTVNEQLVVQGGRKRKSLESNSGSSGRASRAIDHPSSEPKSKRKREETEQTSSQNAKNELQQVYVTSGLKMDLNQEETKDESSAAAALLLTFAPEFSLPSKDELITIFGKFGSLNEKETEVSRDSNCARVAFMRSSDAEEAINSSQKVSPFGHAEVNYHLHYSSAVSGASDLDGNSHLQPTPLHVEENKPSTSPSASRPPAL